MERQNLSARKIPNWPQLGIAIAIIWLGFALRLHNLAGDSFWHDEIVTVRVVQQGLEGILQVRDHPPLMYILTMLSVNTLGENEFAARLPALLAGLLALPLLILLGKVIRYPIAGLWAAFLLALTPFHVVLSQTARHYALLTTLSLATYILLYLALKRLRYATWLLFAGLTLLNLYNHYGALIVLASQIILIIAWLSPQILRGERKLSDLLPIGAAALIVILFFLPWLPRFLNALTLNAGEGVVTDTGTAVPLITWARNAFWFFSPFAQNALTDPNPFGSPLSYFILILAILGLLVLARRHRWLALSLLITATIISLVLIVIFQVARGPFSRYISFILPFYLFSAGLSLAVLPQVTVGRYLGKTALFYFSIGLALAIALAARPALLKEYRYVQEDWPSILTYLQQEANEGDILVAMSLNFRDHFNLVASSLPYYLNKDDRGYVLLASDYLRPKSLAGLKDEQREVWAIVADWDTPTALYKSSFEFEPFQSGLYVTRVKEQSGSSLDRLIDLYNQMIPLAGELTQQCLMRLDRATLFAANDDWPATAGEFVYLEESCPEFLKSSWVTSLHMLAQSHTGQLEAARSTAASLLALDRKDQQALEMLTAFDLLDLYEAGAAQVNDANAPEPVRLMRFTMPHNGDWGDVILIHPPASVAYDLTLPQEPVVFRSRVALAPESWSWGGDGVTFVLQVQTSDGVSAELFRQHIGNSDEEHDWHEVEVPLAGYAGQEVTLILSTETGPVGDGTGDWAGWETPRLMWSTPAEGD